MGQSKLAFLPGTLDAMVLNSLDNHSPARAGVMESVLAIGIDGGPK